MDKLPVRAIPVDHFAILALLLLAPAFAIAQNTAATSASAASTAENRTAHALDLARTDPQNLYAFLVRMPKGADLHNHLTGAMYAESWIGTPPKIISAWNCHVLFSVRARTDSFRRNQLRQRKPTRGASYQDQHLYDALIDAFSMRGSSHPPA